MDKFYTVDDVATMLKLDRQTILRRIKAGKLSAIKIGRYWRISESDLNQFIEAARGNGKNKGA